VHRDLKPANIFFNEGVVKIADFGFAIRNSDLKKNSSYNVGSPVYMPLEALNDNQYSAKSDIWAIGVIFFEMLTGHTPWKAKTESDLKRQIKAISIKSLIPGHLSRSSSDFLLKSLQLNQTLRMTTEEMINFFDNDSNESSLMSTNLRTNSLFRTRAISQDREERKTYNNNPEDITKNTVTAPKSYRKMSRLG
jgi:serine/threonine protein kinase